MRAILRLHDCGRTKVRMVSGCGSRYVRPSPHDRETRKVRNQSSSRGKRKTYGAAAREAQERALRLAVEQQEDGDNTQQVRQRLPRGSSHRRSRCHSVWYLDLHSSHEDDRPIESASSSAAAFGWALAGETRCGLDEMTEGLGRCVLCRNGNNEEEEVSRE